MKPPSQEGPTQPKDSGRVILDEAGKAALSEMFSNLKREECIQLTSGRLASWILAHYRANHFERDRREIVQAHFNSKEYLRKVIKDMDPQENVADVLSAALKRLSMAEGVQETRGRKRKKPRSPDDGVETTDPAAAPPGVVSVDTG